MALSMCSGCVAGISLLHASAFVESGIGIPGIEKNSRERQVRTPELRRLRTVAQDPLSKLPYIKGMQRTQWRAPARAAHRRFESPSTPVRLRESLPASTRSR